MLFNFLQAGFQRGEAGVYVASQETPTQIRRQMERFGLDVKALERDGVLRIFSYDEWYMTDGEVNFQHMLMLANRVLDEARAMGLNGLRGCGEAACFFRHKKQKELVEYELMIGRKLELPVTLLCAYDVNHTKSLKEKHFFSLIKAHGPVVTTSFAQEVQFETFFPTTVNRVLENIFGKIGQQTILNMLANRHSFTLCQLAEHPDYFIEELRELVGSGERVITKSIVNQMHSHFGIP